MSRVALSLFIAAAMGGAASSPAVANEARPARNPAPGMFQPTPRQVLPLERRAGVAATPAQVAAHRRILRRIDRELLGPDRTGTTGPRPE